MKVVLQRVTTASVAVDKEIVGEIGPGLLAFVGIGHQDTELVVEWMADKTIALRVFEDDAGKMNRSLAEIHGSVLAVSQFTLYGDCRKGRRPSFVDAAQPEHANRLYEYYVQRLRSADVSVKTGVFAANMQVALVNDGPVTMILEK